MTVRSSNEIGSSSINNSGRLTLDYAEDQALKNSITGIGTVEKVNGGALTLIQDALWTGNTDIREGALVMGSAEHPVSIASSEVNVASGAKLSGFGSLKGNLTNSGEVTIGSEDGPFSTFVVEGNYEGRGGRMNFKSALGTDDSPTDRLVIKGKTSGKTVVAVTNLGGKGAQTEKGIKLIEVNGSSDGKFSQAGRIVAGAYDYYLERGTGSESKNWYLKTHELLVRPEASSYIANEQVDNSAFNTRLHDRLGETRYIDAFSGEVKTTSLWLRQVGSYNSWKSSIGDSKTRTNLYVAQLGADIAAWAGSENAQRFEVGWMAGFAHSRSKTHALATGAHSIGKTDGYSFGLYGT